MCTLALDIHHTRKPVSLRWAGEGVRPRTHVHMLYLLMLAQAVVEEVRHKHGLPGSEAKKSKEISWFSH
jgi:hypothetical protein